MSDGELVKTTGEIIQEAASGTSGLAVGTVLASAGGIVSVAGKAVIGGLVKRGLDDLFERYAKAKEAEKVPEDFEETDHGASLLQEALNAMCRGLDIERAEAVKKVFLGLAMTPVADSLERIQQVDIMRTVSALTTWEVVLINALERYSKEVFDPIAADKFSHLQSTPQQGAFRRDLNRKARELDVSAWLHESFANKDKFSTRSLREAWGSLHSKHILRRVFDQTPETTKDCIYQKLGAFSDFGWKLAVHLYSATEP